MTGFHFRNFNDSTSTVAVRGIKKNGCEMASVFLFNFPFADGSESFTACGSISIAIVERLRHLVSWFPLDNFHHP